MGRFWGLLLAVLLPTIAFAGGPTNPPGPIPTTCGGGNSFTAYPGYGRAPTCGGALSTGTVNVGDAPQIAQYVGAASVLLGPVTVSGDGALATGGALTISSIGGQAVTLGGALTTTQAITTSGTGAITMALGNSVATLTFQGTDTYVGRATTDTLTNKTLTSPILVTPALGTPSSGTLTNATGLPIAGITGLGAGVGTFLAAPTGPNLTTALSSGGGTVNFLRADGTFAAPAGTTAAANPTGTAGLAAVNGVATTFMRSDAAPAVVAASTSTAGLAKLHNVPLATGWVAGVNPNNVTIAIVNQASTISAVIGDVETATGSAATVSVVSAPSGTACSAGTVLHSGTFNANGTAATNQTLTLTTTTIAAGSRLCLQTTGTTSWTGGTGIGGITVFLAPT